MLRRIINIRQAVHDILEEYPETRDNDCLLILKIWKSQDPDLPQRSMNDFATQFIGGKFCDTESIRRCRQAIQRNNPALRGNVYYGRQKAAFEMRDQIKLFK